MRKEIAPGVKVFFFFIYLLVTIQTTFRSALPKWESFIEVSFLSLEMRERYKELIKGEAKQLEL